MWHKSYPARLVVTGGAMNGDISPRKAFARKVDMSRPGDHPDVLRYRYSNGLCPDVYQVSHPLSCTPSLEFDYSKYRLGWSLTIVYSVVAIKMAKE